MHVVTFYVLTLTPSLCLCLVTKQTIYSLKELQVSNGVRLPRDVNRMKLEVCAHKYKKKILACWFVKFGHFLVVKLSWLDV